MFNPNAFYIENNLTSEAAWRLDLIGLEPVAIGTIEPPVFQNDCGIAIGDHAGYWDQGDCAVAIGRRAGSTFQGNHSIAVGSFAGAEDQGEFAVAIGAYAGQTLQPQRSVVINATGAPLSEVTQSQAFYVAPIREATANRTLYYNTTTAEISYGPGVAKDGQFYSDYLFWDNNELRWEVGSEKIHLGANAGQTNQGSFAVALGYEAGRMNQGSYAIAIGREAGKTDQPEQSIVINATGVALGGVSKTQALYIAPINSGTTSNVLFYDTTTKEVMVGSTNTIVTNGTTYSQYLYWNPDSSAWAVGGGTVRIGEGAGYTQQQTSAVALGLMAGHSNQGSYAIAIGREAGKTDQPEKSIVLNATGAALGTVTKPQALYVAPVSTGTTSNVLYYDTTSKEIMYGAAPNPIPNGSTYSQYLYWDPDLSAWTVGGGTVRIGEGAGYTQQQTSAVALGLMAGHSNQGSYAIAIGREAGKTDQPEKSIVLNATGAALGTVTKPQALYVAPVSTGTTSNVLFYDTTSKEIMYGAAPNPIPNGSTYSQYLYWDPDSSAWTVGGGTVRIGEGAGYTQQQTSAVALGLMAGHSNQGSYAIAIGREAGKTDQPEKSIVLNATGAALGTVTKPQALYVAPVSTGTTSNVLFYDTTSKEIMYGAAPNPITNGSTYSQYLYWEPDSSAWAVGGGTVRIGEGAGYTQQQTSAVALGLMAGHSNQGSYAIAIGREAGKTDQPEKSIVLNATGAALGTVTKPQALYVAPVSAGTTSNVLFYDTTSKEIMYGAAPNPITNGSTYSQYLYWDPDSSAWAVGGGTVRLGEGAGYTQQQTSAVAVGLMAGHTNQGSYAIAIGREAGKTDQPEKSIVLNATGVALGTVTKSQALYVAPVSSGTTSNVLFYDTTSKEIMYGAVPAGSVPTGSTQSQYLYWLPGTGWVLGTDQIRLGAGAGALNQQTYAVALGFQAGYDGQQSQAVAVGFLAGYTGQQSLAVAIGAEAGEYNQVSQSVAVGWSAGNSGQRFQAVAVGPFAGYTNQQQQAVAVGNSAGAYNQGSFSMALGSLAGKTGQLSYSIAIGLQAGETNQGQIRGDGSNATFSGTGAVAIGIQAGNFGQGFNSVAIGREAGSSGQHRYSVAIGYQAGYTSQWNGNVAIGYQAGYADQQVDTIAIGDTAGRNSQGTYAVAIGTNAGNAAQGTQSIALGNTAAEIYQGGSAVAIGEQAGQYTQASGSVVAYSAILSVARLSNTATILCGTPISFVTGQIVSIKVTGDTTFNATNVAITVVGVSSFTYSNTGVDKIATNDSGIVYGPGLYSIAVGAYDGQYEQGHRSIAIGFLAGQYYQSGFSSLASNIQSVARLGNVATITTTASHPLVTGQKVRVVCSNTSFSAYNVQITVTGTTTFTYPNPGTDLGITVATGEVYYRTADAIAIGTNAGNTNQGATGIAIGRNAAQYDQGIWGVAIGTNAGQCFQGDRSIAIGIQAGEQTQSIVSIAIGNGAGQYTQGDRSIAIGNAAAQFGQKASTVAIGRQAGQYNQNANAVAIGAFTALTGQGSIAIAIGLSAGVYNQGGAAIAMGDAAGYTSQGGYGIAIGAGTGFDRQGDRGVAIGYYSGRSAQQYDSIAIGTFAGQSNQRNGCVAIGYEAGGDNQGINCIAIGQWAGRTAQPARSIILNATGGTLNATTTDAFYVNPIRRYTVAGLSSANEMMFYDRSTREITSQQSIFWKFFILGTTGSIAVQTSKDYVVASYPNSITFVNNAPILIGNVIERSTTSFADQLTVSFRNITTTGYTITLRNNGNVTALASSSDSLILGIMAVGW
jgi:hypothetical protein